MCAWNNCICTAFYSGLIPRVTGSLQLLLPCFVVHTPSWLLLYRKINLVQGFNSYVCLERSERNEAFYDRKDCAIDEILKIIDGKMQVPFIDIDNELQIDKKDIKKYLLERWDDKNEL